MKKVIICMLALLIIITGCASDKAEESEKVQKVEPEDLRESMENDADAVSEKNSDSNKVVSVNEEIMDRFFIETEIDIPGKRYKSYQTTLKEFKQDELIALLLPNATTDQIQVESFDDGAAVSIAFQEEDIAVEQGTMRYIKDKEIKYIDRLVSFAAYSNRLEDKELEFMSSEQAVDQASSLMLQFGLGTNLGEPVINAFTKEDLGDLQEYMMNYDEDFRQMYEDGRLLLRDEFNDEDETYRIQYIFIQDGLPVFGPEEPELYATGGIEAPLPAFPMEAIIYISSAGIRCIDLYDVVSDDMQQSEEQEIILWDGIKKALIKKYGDVILTEENKVIDIWLEYIPIRDANTYGSVELVPAWCCEFEMDDSDVEEGMLRARHADRFNAFTGEEIS